MADYITTFSKIHINPLNPEKDKIKLEDIAHALSLLCRANGHFKHFYSVGQHCINCALEAKSRGLSDKTQLACLLHDGSEAYLSDITRPVKGRLNEYLQIEKVLQQEIYNTFNLADLSIEEKHFVEEIEDAMLYYEFLELMDEKIFEIKPTLSSIPNFDFNDFKTIEQRFLSLVNPKRKKVINGSCIGIDGCKGGFICAVIESDELEILKINQIDEIGDFSNLNPIIIDMPVGLPSSKEHIRPDSCAREIIKERTSTIFPVPCRQAVYAKTVADAYMENERVLGKKFTPLTVGILPKIREVDLFLQNNIQYKNRLIESHPEVCFAILNGKTLLSKKSEIDGINERFLVLKNYIPQLNMNELVAKSKEFKCNIDDIMDAICLSVTCTFVMSGEFKTIPQVPAIDETGILMQMVVPKI